MIKKIYQILFITLFLAIISFPFLLADRSSDGISEDENRTLSPKASLITDGALNPEFPAEYETWFMDHLGFRSQLINVNAWIQYHFFHQLLKTSDYYLGVNDNLNYASDEMLRDFQHLNLWEESAVKYIGDSYQRVSDWVEEKGIQFYYVQCYDKHSIYPEQFMEGVNQIGEESKTDQVIGYLTDHTTVDVISLKDILIENKSQYEVYSSWGDPTHWSQRGAFIGYQAIMERINSRNHNRFQILSEEDYEIQMKDLGKTFNEWIHVEDIQEAFTIANPSAVKTDEREVMGAFAEDSRHSRWVNPEAGNQTKLLIMGDSYINSFIIEDFAEGFAETWMVWGDYTGKLPEVIEQYQPDIVIYECAERVDRSRDICKLAEALKENE